ncbi:MAG: transcriptional regulator [Bryobacteraceae bacterium]
MAKPLKSFPPDGGGDIHSEAAPRGAGARRVGDLDRVIHERVRLGVVSALAVNKSLTFNELKQLLDTTDGNLSVHTRRLEEAGYVECAKSFEGRMPRTDYKLTVGGRAALERYLAHMEAIINATRGNQSRGQTPGG